MNRQQLQKIIKIQKKKDKKKYTVDSVLKTPSLLKLSIKDLMIARGVK